MNMSRYKPYRQQRSRGRIEGDGTYLVERHVVSCFMLMILFVVLFLVQLLLCFEICQEELTCNDDNLRGWPAVSIYRGDGHRNSVNLANYGLMVLRLHLRP